MGNVRLFPSQSWASIGIIYSPLLSYSGYYQRIQNKIKTKGKVCVCVCMCKIKYFKAQFIIVALYNLHILLIYVHPPPLAKEDKRLDDVQLNNSSFALWNYIKW